jgi:orotidine-5'-phosphate decarboxylase
LGRDAVQPFLDRIDKGVILLCRTSNPGARDLQDLDVGGGPLYQHVAQLVAREWNGNGNCALVVGATYPAELAVVRSLVGEMPILVPGVGAQGGEVETVLAAGPTIDGLPGGGLLVNVSRGITSPTASVSGASASPSGDLAERLAEQARSWAARLPVLR